MHVFPNPVLKNRIAKQNWQKRNEETENEAEYPETAFRNVSEQVPEYRQKALQQGRRRFRIRKKRIIISSACMQNQKTGKETEMENYRFTELVRKENGFEFCQAFREEVDWIIGGRDDTYWFVVMKDQLVKETWIGTCRDGVWTDRRVKGKGKKKTVQELPAESTIRRIEERAYFMQDAEWVRNRKPRLVMDAHPHLHYVYGMGEKALDISEAFGVSIAYADLKDLSAGFHLRFVNVGKEAAIPD